MASRERPVDRGSRRGRAILERAGRELRVARVDRGLSCAAVGAAIGVSASEVSRVERGLSRRVPLLTIARLAAVVGVDLSVAMYPGPGPLRDASHTRLLTAFWALVHASVARATEVPLPRPRDQRSWDGMLFGADWRFGVEAETAPGDAQALVRRIQLKARDGSVDGVILLVPDTRRVREFLAAARDMLSVAFPVPTRSAMASLRAGSKPAGNAIIVVPYRRARGYVAPHVTTVR